MIITSRQHPFVRQCRQLAQGRGRPNEILLEGPHLVGEALEARVPLDGVLSDGRHPVLVASAAAHGIATLTAAADVVAAASPVQRGAGIVAIGRWQPKSASEVIGAAGGVVVGLVAVQDPGNVGSIVRSADALGAAAVVALDASAHPGGWKALRAAMGSTFHIAVGTGTTAEAVAAANACGLPVVASVARGGASLETWTAPPAFMLLVGNEGAGLPSAFVTGASARVTIPMRSGIESLNVGVGTAIVLWEATRRRQERST